MLVNFGYTAIHFIILNVDKIHYMFLSSISDLQCFYRNSLQGRLWHALLNPRVQGGNILWKHYMVPCSEGHIASNWKILLSGSVWLRQPVEDLRFDLGISFYGFTRCSWTMPTLRKSPFVIRALLAPCAAVAVR